MLSTCPFPLRHVRHVRHASAATRTPRSGFFTIGERCAEAAVLGTRDRCKESPAPLGVGRFLGQPTTGPRPPTAPRLSLSPTASTHGATECHARTATRTDHHAAHAIAPGYVSNAESVRRKHAEQADPPPAAERETARQGRAHTPPASTPSPRVNDPEEARSSASVYGFPTSGDACAWPAA